MKKIKHSKIKNTGMLFELLVRQITSDIISGNASPATSILEKNFNKNSELFKEYTLYKALSEEKFTSDTKCTMLIDAVVKSRRKLNAPKLKSEKYALIQEISENFDVESFFQTKVQNYKLLASIYKILEYNEHDNPTDMTKSKITIMENMLQPVKEILNEQTAFGNESSDVRLFSYKILVEKFNTKYDDLDPNQKNVLREYIRNVSSTNNLRNFIQAEAECIKEIMTKKIKTVIDKVLKIKLTEVVKMLDKYKDIKSVDENHVTAILRYYDLITDLK